MMLNTLIEADGKIGVVVLVLVVILTGLGLFLFYLDGKVRRMEKQLKQWEESHNSRVEDSHIKR